MHDGICSGVALRFRWLWRRIAVLGNFMYLFLERSPVGSLGCDRGSEEFHALLA